MNPFHYQREFDKQSAISALTRDPSAMFVAGGTNLIDLMKEGVERPGSFVDINRLDLTRIEERDGGLRLGALAKNSDTANNPLVRERYPLLSQAILAGASAQLRNAATNGGNLMQRTRCYYFYDVAMPCNKRNPGSGCGALEGFNRIHAIFGTSDQCIATHPSDMCVVLAALDAVVQVEGPDGSRNIPFSDFHRLPGNTPHIDTNLQRCELITAIDLPASSAVFSGHSYYLKVRDRASYAFALVSVAAALDIPPIAKRAWRSLGCFALECAMDELAYKLNIDPVELRIRNYADIDPESGMRWSSKSLLECYNRGARVFGWSRRNMDPRSMREGRFLVGMGMATGIYHTSRQPASVRARIFADGTAVVQSSASDIGPGTWTTMQIIGAEALGLPIDHVRPELGDSTLPKAPVHGGSMTTESVGSAVHEACLAAKAKLFELATSDERASLRSDFETYIKILKRNQMDSIEASVESVPSEESKKYAKSGFVAQFAEVRIDPELGSVRVSRFVSAASGGRIINEKTARSQLLGGVVGGIGMALTEEAVMDHRMGRFVNSTLAEYHVPVNADIPKIEAFFVEEKDEVVNPIGVKGIAELSYVGVAAAVANAVYHATGKRIRKLPITLDKLL